MTGNANIGSLKPIIYAKVKRIELYTEFMIVLISFLRT